MFSRFAGRSCRSFFHRGYYTGKPFLLKSLSEDEVQRELFVRGISLPPSDDARFELSSIVYSELERGALSEESASLLMSQHDILLHLEENKMPMSGTNEEQRERLLAYWLANPSEHKEGPTIHEENINIPNDIKHELTEEKRESLRQLLELRENTTAASSSTYDAAKVIPQEISVQIDQECDVMREEFDIDVAVLTVDEILPGFTDLNDCTKRIFGVWGLGSREKHNGILFIYYKAENKLAVDFGTGLYSKMDTAAIPSLLNDTMSPLLDQSNHGDALLEGVRGVQVLVANLDVDISRDSRPIFTFMGYAFILSIFLIGVKRKSKTGKKEKESKRVPLSYHSTPYTFHRNPKQEDT